MQNDALSCQHYTRLKKVMHYITISCNATFMALPITMKTCNALQYITIIFRITLSLHSIYNILIQAINTFASSGNRKLKLLFPD